MPHNDLTATIALVTGASRGLGRGIATSLAKAGATVVSVARDRDALSALREQCGDAIIPVVADVTDPVTAGRLIDQYNPQTLVLNAGANPLPRPLPMHTWSTFSRNWDVDVRQTFHWTREALLHPLDPGSVVIAMSSGAALRGSPLSGGYAGAKATVRFIAAYADDEARRRSLDVRFISVLPSLTPQTAVGASGAAAYAARQGTDLAAYIDGLGPTLTPDQAGDAMVSLATEPTQTHPSYLLTPAGLQLLD
jgi:NAD(P)-dependent dehydrogenase (short-subunit alcohol dehydrogenase family)